MSTACLYSTRTFGKQEKAGNLIVKTMCANYISADYSIGCGKRNHSSEPAND